MILWSAQDSCHQLTHLCIEGQLPNKYLYDRQNGGGKILFEAFKSVWPCSSEAKTSTMTVSLEKEAFFFTALLWKVGKMSSAWNAETYSSDYVSETAFSNGSEVMNLCKTSCVVSNLVIHSSTSFDLFGRSSLRRLFLKNVSTFLKHSTPWQVWVFLLYFYFYDRIY